MTVEAIDLMMARREAEARMLDSCTIGVEHSVTDDETLDVTHTIDPERYSGKCRLSTSSSAVSDDNAGSQNFAGQQLVLSVPVLQASAIRTDDTVIYGPVDAGTGDPSLNGARFRVSGLAIGSQMTASRFPVERIS